MILMLQKHERVERVCLLLEATIGLHFIYIQMFEEWSPGVKEILHACV